MLLVTSKRIGEILGFEVSDQPLMTAKLQVPGDMYGRIIGQSPLSLL
jgi:hypothetical protein